MKKAANKRDGDRIWRTDLKFSRLNETARFTQNDAVSYIYIKKKEKKEKKEEDQNGVVLKRHCSSSSSPVSTEQKRKKKKKGKNFKTSRLSLLVPTTTTESKNGRPAVA